MRETIKSALILSTILGTLTLPTSYLFTEIERRSEESREKYQANPNYIKGNVIGESISTSTSGPGSSHSSRYLFILDSKEGLKSFRSSGHMASKLDAIIDKEDIVTVKLGKNKNPSNEDFRIDYPPNLNFSYLFNQVVDIKKKDGRRIQVSPPIKIKQID